MKRTDEIFFLKDVLNSLSKIFKYTENMSYEDFIKDDKTKDAVERNFEIIGEAVKHLSEDFRIRHSHIPFRQVAGMRDKLIHDYFGIDYEIVWKTIITKLPQFELDIIELIQKIEK